MMNRFSDATRFIFEIISSNPSNVIIEKFRSNQDTKAPFDTRRYHIIGVIFKDSEQGQEEYQGRRVESYFLARVLGSSEYFEIKAESIDRRLQVKHVRIYIYSPGEVSYVRPEAIERLGLQLPADYLPIEKFPELLLSSV